MEKEGTPTEAAIEEIKKIRLQMEISRQEQAASDNRRHKMNGELMATLTEISLDNAKQTDRVNEAKGTLTEMGRQVGLIAKELGALKTSLMGNEEYKTNGLIQEVADLKARLVVVEKRADESEKTTDRFKIERAIARGTLATIITIIGFLKGTSIIKWLSGP